MSTADAQAMRPGAARAPRARRAAGHAAQALAPPIAYGRRSAKVTAVSPTLANGKICYIEIPALDVRRSADFYASVFGWRIRRRGDGSAAFDDGAGEVSGTWILGRPAASAPGFLIYVMVDNVAATLESAIAHGGELVQPVGVDAPEITARFRDPAGNVIGLYQEPGRGPAP